MKQQKPLEANFLALESPTQTGHLASLATPFELDPVADGVTPEGVAAEPARGLVAGLEEPCKRAGARTARVVH
ncbi:MAG: hypothetical protein WEF50_18725 [Myxococcota bacterium]